MILKYLRARDWAIIVVVVVLIIIQVYLELEIPGYMSSITEIIQQDVLGEIDDGMSQVVDNGVSMLLCALASLIISVVVAFCAAYIAASLSRTVRAKEFDRVETFSPHEMGRFSVASLITRSTNDVTQVQNAVSMGLMVIVRAPVMAIIAISKIIDKSWEWTTATAVAVVIVLAMIGVIMVYVVPRFRRIQGLTDNVNRVTRENLTGMRVVRAYNAEEYQEAKFDEANFNLTENSLQANRAMAFLYPVMSAVSSMLTLVIYWVGAGLIMAAGMADRIGLFGDMVVFSSYAMQVVMSFIMMVMILMILPRAMVASRRIEEVIDTVSSVADGPGASPQEDGTVEFRDVSFRYPESPEDVVEGISFKAAKGETVAIIGSTGAGKTTLVQMVPRFMDVTEGQVLVDGVDVREYKLDDLRSRIGYAPQKAFMFQGTIASNIRYGDRSEDATEEAVQRAVDIAQARDFVDAKEGGVESPVSQAGSNLSGGQKQRVSVARVVCRHPEIYIFDDTFSALDYKTDRALRDALKRETAGTTTLIVAQRIGTIIDADRIVVLDGGRVAGVGTHRELLKSCPVYLDIARSQLSDQELGI